MSKNFIAVLIHFPSDSRMEDNIKAWLSDEPIIIVNSVAEARVVVTDDVDMVLTDDCRDPEVRKYLFFGLDEKVSNLPNVRRTTMFGKEQVLAVAFGQPYIPADANLIPI